jgi:hypothetical protein
VFPAPGAPEIFRAGKFIRLAFVSVSLASAAGLPGTAASAPFVLSDRQMDGVTAGTATLRLDLSAMAEGSTATTYTAGTVRSADTSILLVQVSPRSHGRPRDIEFKGRVPATVVLAAGQATATGSAGADCSGHIETSGNIAYLAEASLRTRTSASGGFPIAANCACAAIAITLGQH